MDEVESSVKEPSVGGGGGQQPLPLLLELQQAHDPGLPRWTTCSPALKNHRKLVQFHLSIFFHWKIFSERLANKAYAREVEFLQT